MLVLSRKVGQEIIIADNIRVTVLAVNGHRVQLGIEAPASVRVDREEIHQRMKEARPLCVAEPRVSLELAAQK